MLSLFDKTGREISDQTQYFNNPTYLGEPWCSGWGISKEMYKAANEMSGSEMEEEQYDELFLVLEEPQGGYTVPPPSVNHTPSTSSLQPVQSSSTHQSVVHDFLSSAALRTALCTTEARQRSRGCKKSQHAQEDKERYGLLHENMDGVERMQKY